MLFPVEFGALPGVQLDVCVAAAEGAASAGAGAGAGRQSASGGAARCASAQAWVFRSKLNLTCEHARATARVGRCVWRGFRSVQCHAHVQAVPWYSSVLREKGRRGEREEGKRRKAANTHTYTHAQTQHKAS